MDIKKISPFLSVSPQINVADLRKIAARGFRTVINNRPDGEAEGQPLNTDLADEAKKSGLVYVYQPVSSKMVTDGDAVDFATELDRARGPVLAFCRTGTRCTILWALNEAHHMDADDLMRFARSIGIKLKGERERLAQIFLQSNMRSDRG
jgi:sulfide:quinone oxidoreductase